MMFYYGAKNDLEYSISRLDGILSRRRLRLNPYAVSDKRLLEMVYDSGWGDDMDITQMVVMRFTRLRPFKDGQSYDGIYFCLGRSDKEVFLPLGVLKHGITAFDTLSLSRSIYGTRPLRHDEDVERLVGKTVFVSRTVLGYNSNGFGKVAYRMHRLTGKTQKDAQIIREAMCAAKIEMLERVLANPQSAYFLDCTRNFFDYETRIRHAITSIRNFPNTPIPQQ